MENKILTTILMIIIVCSCGTSMKFSENEGQLHRTIQTYEEVCAFPGAEGFGRYTTGGRG